MESKMDQAQEETKAELRKRMSLLQKFGAITTIFMLLLPILLSIKHTQVFEASDFTMTFYVVGKMCLQGNGFDMYPPYDMTTFINAPFDIYTHKELTKLAANKTAIYMYCPLAAYIFAPLGVLTHTQAIVVWQLICIACLLFIVNLHKRLSGLPFMRLLGMAALFLPIFHQLFIGHLSIPYGLLPLSIGYYLLMKKKYFLGGVAWGFLLLKPQFIPTVMLVLGALLLTKKVRPLLGFLLSVTVLTVFSEVFLGWGLTKKWFWCLHLSDQIFSDPQYYYPHYMAVSIPASVMQAVPESVRVTAKYSSYAVALAIGLASLWLSVKLLKKGDETGRDHLSLVLLLGIFVLPLVVPHFMFYDLCIMATGAFIIYGASIDESIAWKLRQLKVVTFFLCNIYFFCFFLRGLVNDALSKPWVLVVFLTLAYGLMVKIIAPQAFLKEEKPAESDSENSRDSAQQET